MSDLRYLSADEAGAFKALNDFDSEFRVLVCCGSRVLQGQETREAVVRPLAIRQIKSLNTKQRFFRHLA